MNTLKMMFGGGADVAQLAEMIRRFGRGEDKILAHITPEEAAKLREMGGSGDINPMTGLPEFQDDYGELLASERDYSPAANYEGFDATFPNFNQPSYGEVDAPFPSFDQQYPSYGQVAGGLQEPSYLPADAQYEMALADAQRGAPAPLGRAVGEEDENIFRRGERRLEELQAVLNRYPNLTRIGGAGVNLIGQALLAQRANRQREAQAAAERARAAPFRAAQSEAMARAQGGGLTPQQAREMEISQARARQGLSAQNLGAGSAAAGILAGQQTRARSVARQESFDQALKLAGIADDYERRAIAAELAADKELAALFGNILAKEISAATRTEAPPRRG